MLTEKQAREVTSAIQKGMALVPEAFGGMVWRALGYSSWPAYCETEIGGVMKVDVEDRRAVVASLAREGKTQRQIADEVGVSQALVSGDIEAIGQIISTDKQPDTVTGKDGKTYPRRKRSREEIRRLIAKYLTENPGATRNEIAKALRCQPMTVTEVAREIGHQWPIGFGSAAAAKKGGKTRQRNKPVPPPPLPEPLYARAAETQQIEQMRRICNSLASDNGRMRYAQLVTEAINAADHAWLQGQHDALQYVIAYVGDLLSCHIDEAFRARLNTGWEGRDDISDQRVNRPNLRVI